MPPLVTRLLLALLLAAPLAAQNVPDPESTTPPRLRKPAGNGRITGTVLCGDTRKPARGAMLLISPMPNADGTRPQQAEGGRESMIRVGLDGTYTAEHLPPGEYAVIAIFPGYLSPFDDLRASQMDENASPGEERKLLGRQGTVVIRGAEAETFNLTLARGAAISGRVLYSDGSPAAQVSLDLENVADKLKPGEKPQENMNVGRVLRAMFTQQSNSTDDQGHFRVAGLQPGTYRIAAVQSLHVTSAGGSDMGVMFGGMADSAALHFYSGDTIHRKAAKTYELRGGDELTGLEITIPEHAFHQVRGRVLATSGKVANGGEVTFADKSDDSISYSQTLTAEGTFAFPAVPAGTYTLATKDANYSVFTPGSNPTPANPAGGSWQNIQFAPASQDILVKDADVVDLTLSPAELPPDTAPKPPQNN